MKIVTQLPAVSAMRAGSRPIDNLQQRIHASLHEAVFDDALWPAASGLIDKACGSGGNSLKLGAGDSTPDVEIFFACICYRGRRHPDYEREYFQSYHARDERAPRVRLLPDSRIVSNRDMYTEEEKRTSVVYNEFNRRTGGNDGLLVQLYGIDDTRVVLNLGDPVDDDGWTSDRTGVLARLLPHIRHYAATRQALINARAHGATLSAMLDSTGCGVIQLDRRARILAANDRARSLLRTRNGIYDEEGCLHAVSPAENVELQAVLGGALPRFGAGGQGGSVVLRCGGKGSLLVLHITPIGHRAEVRTSGVAAFVLVMEPLGHAHVDLRLVAEILGLTRMEARVAAMLAQGHRLREIAARTGTGYGTLRWHLQNIYAKCGVSTQAQVVHLVTSLSSGAH